MKERYLKDIEFSLDLLQDSNGDCEYGDETNDDIVYNDVNVNDTDYHNDNANENDTDKSNDFWKKIIILTVMIMAIKLLKKNTHTIDKTTISIATSTPTSTLATAPMKMLMKSLQ